MEGNSQTTLDPLEVTPEVQSEAEHVRNRYRKLFACHYIPDINAIREQIDKEKDPEKVSTMTQKIKEITSYFSQVTFVQPNHYDAYKSQSQRRETYLDWSLIEQLFKFPVFVDKYYIRTLKLKKGVFYADSTLVYFALVHPREKDTISKLISRKYKVLGEIDGFLKIGREVDFQIPFNNSDEIFFFSKYFLYFHLYSLLNGFEKSGERLKPSMEKLLGILETMFEGFLEDEGERKVFQLKEHINSSQSVHTCYNKFIFSEARSFNQRHKKFLFAMQILSQKVNS